MIMQYASYFKLYWSPLLTNIQLLNTAASSTVRISM